MIDGQETTLLDSQRHNISRESLEHMRALRDILPAIQAEEPRIQGLAFFGSRILGHEKEAPHVSDLDTFIFYDGTEFEEEGPIIGTPEDFVTLDEARMHRNFHREQALIKMERAAKGRIEKVMTSRRLPIDFTQKRDANSTVLFINISQSQTDLLLADFMHEVHVGLMNDYKIYSGINSGTRDLWCRFLFGTGEGLYRNRSYILNKLAEMDDGELFFQALMDCLISFERGGGNEVNYGKLPKTIAEAREYFLTRPESSS